MRTVAAATARHVLCLPSVSLTMVRDVNGWSIRDSRGGGRHGRLVAAIKASVCLNGKQRAALLTMIGKRPSASRSRDPRPEWVSVCPPGVSWHLAPRVSDCPRAKVNRPERHRVRRGLVRIHEFPEHACTKLALGD